MFPENADKQKELSRQLDRTRSPLRPALIAINPGDDALFEPFVHDLVAYDDAVLCRQRRVLALCLCRLRVLPIEMVLLVVAHVRPHRFSVGYLKDRACPIPRLLSCFHKSVTWMSLSMLANTLVYRTEFRGRISAHKTLRLCGILMDILRPVHQAVVVRILLRVSRTSYIEDFMRQHAYTITPDTVDVFLRVVLHYIPYESTDICKRLARFIAAHGNTPLCHAVLA